MANEAVRRRKEPWEERCLPNFLSHFVSATSEISVNSANCSVALLTAYRTKVLAPCVLPQSLVLTRLVLLTPRSGTASKAQCHSEIKYRSLYTFNLVSCCQQVVGHLVQVGSLVCVNEAHHFFKHFRLHVVDFHTILTEGGEEKERRRRVKWRHFRNTFTESFVQLD